jgi:hypothetical protein
MLKDETIKKQLITQKDGKIIIKGIKILKWRV